MKIVLIGNYPPDRQQSMIRFANLLSDGFTRAGFVTEIWWPQPVLTSKITDAFPFLKKWLGYIDKWIIYPFLLKKKLRKIGSGYPTVWFHVCDHSNSPYLKYFPKEKSSITCHDVLAIRGARGDSSVHAPASITGKLLQKWIFANLKNASRLAAVSNHTLGDLKDLCGSEFSHNKDWRLIYNSLNGKFSKLDADYVNNILQSIGFPVDRPFILHVGGGHLRKNRQVLVDMLELLKDSWHGNICFAGEQLDNSLLSLIHFHKLSEKVISLIEPSHEVLACLYNRCSAFVFPSFSEGFGWPLIEAQACGAPVITSDREPMREVTGGAAYYADPNKPAEFVSCFLSIQKNEERLRLIDLGYANVRRFGQAEMINKYLQLFGSHVENGNQHKQLVFSSQ